MFRPSGLPIDAALPALRAALAAHRSAVLHAPPGAGKSTVVPLALAAEPWAADRRILLLEPRRLAARAVARRMAATLGERVGDTVGYRMRLDTRVSRATRIEVVTEGVLTRMVQSDPAFDGIACVIFDEFHERSLQADLGLALTLDARANLCPSLRVLVMSATLDAAAVSDLLGEAPLVSAPGRMHPVELHYLGAGPALLPESAAAPRRGPPADTPERAMARAIRRALAEAEGDVLAFLPGAAEIRRIQRLLEEGGLDAHVRVRPLFGDLPPQAQDEALAPARGGERRVVLATNIAETSLTIEGIRVVVDCGLARHAPFDPASGMSRLETRRISRASAEQRAGRAGRLAPGACYRLWSEGAHASLAPFTPAEILEADLAPLALELASWGARDARSLAWLDPPPAALLESARDLLRRLGALDAQGRITEHGREMAALPLHPRLAHMLLRARALGQAPAAAELAALLSERDLLRGAGAARDADIRSRLDALRGRAADTRADPGAVQRVRRAAAQILRQAGEDAAGESRETASRASLSADPGELLALAFPDRIGRRRPGDEPRYALANGRGAHFGEAQTLAREELIVAVELDDREREARILLAAPLTRAALEEAFGEELVRAEGVEWNSREQAVTARRTVRLGQLVIEEQPLPKVPADAAHTAMLSGIRELGLEALPWSRETRELQARIELLRREQPEGGWPACDDASLLANLDAWLAPWLEGVTRREHLARLPLREALLARLDHAHQRRLEELAPTHLAVPSGSRIRVDYLDESAPVVAVRLQEVFGLQETPRIAGGRVPITFKLLSPAQRPVQVTRDLASFWRGAYAEVRKDLRGRYPKHHWPENPLEAAPVRGAKRKRPG